MDPQVPPTPDNDLEASRPDDTTNTVVQANLPEDHDSPASPAVDPVSPGLPDDHPLTDTDIDPSEIYGEGMAAATGIDDQRSINEA